MAIQAGLMIPLGLSSNSLARFFNTSHQFWLNLQSNYDVQCAEDAAGRAIAKIPPWTDTGAPT